MEALLLAPDSLPLPCVSGQVKGAEKILYGLDDIADADEITIVEGEIDKLSLCEAGIRNAVSVPDGAPAKVSREGVPPPEEVTQAVPRSPGSYLPHVCGTLVQEGGGVMWRSRRRGDELPGG